MRLEVGGTYEWNDSGDPTRRRSIMYLCLEECEAETERFKRKEPGYKLLVLHVERNVFVAKAGDVLVVPRVSNITVGVRRLD